MQHAGRPHDARDALAVPRPLLLAIAGTVLVRAVIAAATGLTDDEAYYRLWTLAPALSYLDHPPMAAWMMTAGRWLAGDTAFGLRLPSLAISLVGPFMMWRTACLLFDRQTALWATVFSLVMPLLAVGGIVITPDAPSVLFWGLCAWALAELHVSRDANWWLVLGLCAGLGLVSKYTNLFVGVGIVLWLVLGPGNRHWFRAWQLWVGGAIALLCTAPVVVWNAQHGWVSFAKQFGRAVRGSNWTLTYLFEMAGGVLGLASPLIAVLGVIGLVRVTRSAVRTRDARALLIVTGVLPLLAYFLVHALHARVQANWLAPLYPMLALLGAHVLVTSEPRTRPRWTVATVGLGVLLSAAIYLHAVRPFVVLPEARDPTAQMHGWPEFAARVEALRTEHGARWIATASYATTGQLAFGLRGRGVPVEQLNERIRYIHLGPVAPELAMAPALYVEHEDRGADAFLAQRFGSVRRLGVLARTERGATLATYAVYLVAAPKDPATLFAPTLD